MYRSGARWSATTQPAFIGSDRRVIVEYHLVSGATEEAGGLTSKQRDGIDRRAGAVLDAQWSDVEQELPATKAGRGVAERFKVAVVQEPQAHSHDPDLVDRDAYAV